MKFRSFAHNYRMVVRPEDLVRDQYGRVIQGVPGFVAQFRGGYFDSGDAQIRFGWSDDERLAMERFIMSNHAFRELRTFDGGGSPDRPLGNVGMMEVDLAPGQTVPREHEEFISTLPRFASTTLPGVTVEGRKCAAKIETPEGVQLCVRDALEDSEYCAVHSPIAVVT